MKRGLKWMYGTFPVLANWMKVEESSPMKRGLKYDRRIWVKDAAWVEESSPMKRGLKLGIPVWKLSPGFSS